MHHSGLFFILNMAWRNLWRQKRRTFITVFSLSLGLAICIPTYGLMDGLSAKMIRGITTVHLGNIQIHNKQYIKQRQIKYTLPYYQIINKINNIRGIKNIAPRVYTGGMIGIEHKLKVILQQYNSKLQLKLLKGKILNPRDKCSGLIDYNFAKKWRINLGTILRINNNLYEKSCEKIVIKGIFKTLNHQQPTIYMNKIDVGLILYGLSVFKDKKIKSFKKLQNINKDSKEDDDDIDNLPKLGEKTNKEPHNLNDQLPKNLLTKGECTIIRAVSNQVGIVAINPSAEQLVTQIHSNLISGKYLNNSYTQNSSGKINKEILIGKKLAGILMVKSGDVLGMDLITKEGFPLDDLFKIKGIFKTGLDSMDRMLVYIHIQNAWDKNFMNLTSKHNSELIKNIHELAIKTNPKYNNQIIANQIKTKLNNKNYKVRTWQEIEPSLAQMVMMQDALTAIILLIIFIIAALGTMNTMLMAVFERTKEFGVLKAIGMKPTYVVFLIIIETFLMTIISAILGGILGHFTNIYLSVYGLDLSNFIPNGYTIQGVFISPVWKSIVSLHSILLPVGVLCIVSIIISIWPAIRAAKINPVKAFRSYGL